MLYGGASSAEPSVSRDLRHLPVCIRITPSDMNKQTSISLLPRTGILPYYSMETCRSLPRSLPSHSAPYTGALEWYSGCRYTPPSSRKHTASPHIISTHGINASRTATSLLLCLQQIRGASSPRRRTPSPKAEQLVKPRVKSTHHAVQSQGQERARYGRLCVSSFSFHVFIGIQDRCTVPASNVARMDLECEMFRGAMFKHLLTYHPAAASVK